MAPIRAGGVPVIYQVHDLESNWLPQTPVVRRVDQAIKRALLQSADAWVVHESSALAPIEDFSGLRPRLFARCQLGNYAKFHGAPVPRDQARARLGIPLGGCVFLWSGYCNERRDPRHVLRAFQRVAGPGARLLISGMNAGEFLAGSSHGDRVHIFDRLITNETYRDLVCASDWIVMDADKHLTSAVVRTALSYHRPVLCRPFGSQRDMAQDAAIWLDGLSPDRALERAQAMPAAEYERMTAAASARDSERTWARYHEAYGDLLGQLNAAAPGRRPYFSAHP
jgi:hypothetical protein